MQAQLRLALSIEHRLAEVKQALILTDVLNVLLDEAELVQAHLEIVKKVRHRVMKKVKLVDILLKDLCAADLARAFGRFLRSLGEYLLRFVDLSLEDCDVTFKHLDFKLALFGFVEVDIIVHIVGSVLALARGNLVVAPD